MFKCIEVEKLKRAAISVSSYIAEGYARKSKIETKRFLDIARSSIVEIDTQITICLTLNYFSESDITELCDLINHNFALISKLISSIK
ncbi:MAG: four helix bundle protein [Ignavibacteriae bacterium]|nr:four helix bundle protein [Ignavibacteriota bacterium]